ncbi:MAG: gliding motility-associated C-terminal domain-containing protein [Saprospiraceae bacterium]|nr:gliding motility-associated C-terminal domain-containing protein [Saprospiraceae bacterium]
MRFYRLLSILTLYLLSAQALLGQDYLKTLDSPEKYLQQKIARTELGEIVIGTSSLEALNTGDDGKIFLSKLDNCGQLRWSYSYQTKGFYAEFRDIVIGQDGSIFVFGSAYQGFDERVMLLKVNSQGEVKRFKLYNTGTVDHFTYNIAMKDNRVLAYGLLLDWNIQKQGFIAVFDDELNYEWGKRFTPFDTGGEAIFTEEGGFLCRSDKYTYMLTPNGELQWASEGTSDSPVPTTGPVSVSGGYIFQVIRENQSFFYKLAPDGTLSWKSPAFTSTKYPASIRRESNGDIIAIYGYPTNNTNELCYLWLSADGQILEQRRLVTAQAFNTGEIYHSLDEDGYLTIAGNGASIPATTPSLRNFLLQVSMEKEETDCFYWEPFQETFTHDYSPKATAIDTAISELNMSLYDGSIQIERASTLELKFNNACESTPDQSQLEIDTTLQCGENWLIDLPSPEFIWLDNASSEPRLVEEAGTYQASNLSCTNPIAYTYTISREACSCAVYLPNAFSPNNDGQNDQLSLFSGCTVSQISTAVYSRWGDKLVENKSTDQIWDGRSGGKAVPPGLYLVVINYQLMDEVGELQDGEIVQEVMLIK